MIGPPNQTTPLRLAIFCSTGVGDALVQMIIAKNLADMGTMVRFYSDIAIQLQPLVSAYEFAQLPSYADVLSELADQHVVLYDSSAPFIVQLPRRVERWFKQNAICYRMSDKPPRHQSISIDQIAARLPQENRHLAGFFKKFNATLRAKSSRGYRPPIVEQLCNYLQKEIGFVSITSDNGIARASNIKRMNKVLIHPTSSSPKKNWPAAKYHELADRISAKGMQVVFTVSPAERDAWLDIVGGKYPVPKFPNLSDLANFYQDARLFVGNDSGNAHLASYFGVPTVQIFKRYRQYPAWRAGWAKNRVVIAKIPYRFATRNWHKGVSVNSVLSTINSVLEE